MRRGAKMKNIRDQSDLHSYKCPSPHPLHLSKKSRAVHGDAYIRKLSYHGYLDLFILSIKTSEESQFTTYPYFCALRKRLFTARLHTHSCPSNLVAATQWPQFGYKSCLNELIVSSFVIIGGWEDPKGRSPLV